jgi:hypothetical protein
MLQNLKENRHGSPGILGENRKCGVKTVHFMDELPEYKDIDDKYRHESEKLEQYRDNCKDEALDMLKNIFGIYGIKIGTNM